MNLNKRLNISLLMTILLCGIAVQYMFISIILNDNIMLKFWKEIILLISIVGILFFKLKNNSNQEISFLEEIKHDYNIYAHLLFIILLLLSAIFMSKSISGSIYVIRLYLIPILVYYIAKYNNFTKESIVKLINIVVKFYCIISLWGVFQALALGDDFLINLGYPLKYAGRLRDSFYFGGFGDFQRVVSTFSNVNVFAGVIGILIIILIFNSKFFESKKIKYSALFIFSITLLLTFSRSNWVAMGVVLLIASIKNKKILKNSILVLVSIFILLVIVELFTEYNIITMLKEYIFKTLTLQEGSSLGRFGIWKEGAIAFLNNPLGTGLGNVGMVSKRIFGEIHFTGESSYLAILLDVGIQGAICYFFVLFREFYMSLRINSENTVVENYLKTKNYIIIYLLILFIFSNHIYDLEIMIVTFFFIGLGSNKYFLNSFKNIDINKNN